jgi:hypothetical protein
MLFQDTGEPEDTRTCKVACAVRFKDRTGSLTVTISSTPGPGWADWKTREGTTRAK